VLAAGKDIDSLLFIEHLERFNFQKEKVNVLLICCLPGIPAIIVIANVFGLLEDQSPAVQLIKYPSPSADFSTLMLE
jgi:hypothetical protein